MTTDESAYWVYGWLDSHRVSSIEDLRVALGQSSCLAELTEVAEAWHNGAPAPPQGVNLIAGTGLRLDDMLTCPYLRCRRKQVDVLFRHAWHYFDRILIPDGVGHVLLHPPQWETDVLLTIISDWIAIAMHIRELGAAGLVHYYPKSTSRDHILTENDIPLLAAEIDDVATVLAEQCDFTFERTNPRTITMAYHDPLTPVAGGSTWVFESDCKLTDQELRIQASRQLAVEHLNYFDEDLGIRKRFNGALGSIMWSHEILSGMTAPSAHDVILRIVLPGLSDVPIKELIAIRAGEEDAFLRFRNSLTKAAQETIMKGSTLNRQKISDTIVSDIVQPELSNLKRRLKLAQGVLTDKTTVSVALSGLATTCGLLLGASPAVAGAAGVGALVAQAGTAAAKYIEEKRAIEFSDMYFMWKALGHAHRVE